MIVVPAQKERIKDFFHSRPQQQPDGRRSGLPSGYALKAYVGSDPCNVSPLVVVPPSHPPPVFFVRSGQLWWIYALKAGFILKSTKLDPLRESPVVGDQMVVEVATAHFSYRKIAVTSRYH